MIPGIGSDRNGDTQPGLLGEALELVIPTGDNRGAWDLPEIEVIHLFVDHLSHSRPSKTRCAWLLVDGTVFIDNCPIDKQHPCFFLQRHLSQKIFHASLNWLARIFIDIQFAILVEIPET